METATKDRTENRPASQQFMRVLNRLAQGVKDEALKDNDGTVEFKDLPLNDRLVCVELTWTPTRESAIDLDRSEEKSTVWRMFAGGFHQHESLVKLEHGDFDTAAKRTIYVSMVPDVVLAVVSFI